MFVAMTGDKADKNEEKGSLINGKCKECEVKGDGSGKFDFEEALEKEPKLDTPVCLTLSNQPAETAVDVKANFDLEKV